LKQRLKLGQLGIEFSEFLWVTSVICLAFHCWFTILNRTSLNIYLKRATAFAVLGDEFHSANRNVPLNGVLWPSIGPYGIYGKLVLHSEFMRIWKLKSR
jgi:hypothetical protein